jgi:hypothetical protein
MRIGSIPRDRRQHGAAFIRAQQRDATPIMADVRFRMHQSANQA